MQDIADIAVPEIEITPEMLKAGIKAFMDYDSRFEQESDAVIEIFEAMWAAKVRGAV